MERVLLIKYGEIALRKNNRHIFENKIIYTIRRNLKGLGEYYVEREQGRFILRRLDSEMDFDIVIEKVKNVLGITEICPSIMFPEKNMDIIFNFALQEIAPHLTENKTFKVVSKRADKNFIKDSVMLSSEIGDYILSHSNTLKVDVKNPEIKLFVEIRTQCYIYVSSRVVKTFGGLPEGSSGRGLLMLSGGIDSPVAYFKAAKRGVKVNCVYFHAPPYTSERVLLKVKDLAKTLAEFTGGTTLYVVPITKIQLYLLERVPEEKLTIFLKRAMTKLAFCVAEKEGSVCLITGDSIGQVASQTLQALHAVSYGINMPILRPLCGYSKQEIVDVAREIGTFEISILPYDDCCTTFVPKHPDLKPKTSVIISMENKMEEMQDLLDDAISNMQIFEL